MLHTPPSHLPVRPHSLQEKPLQMALERMQKSNPTLQVSEKAHKVEHFMALLWGKQTEGCQNWPDFVGLREDIQS